MTPETIDYVAILADMRAKRTALDASITALEAALASGTLGQAATVPSGSSNSSSASSAPSELPVGAFLGKSVPVAIKLYLSVVKRKQTNQEITAALRDGGIESTGNLDKVVTGALLRLKAAGEVLRFKDGWGLAEHYNESFRARLAQNQKPPKAKKKPRVKAKGKTAKQAKPEAPKQETETPPREQPATTPNKGGEQIAIEAHFNARPGEELTSAQVASALGIRVQTVGLICSKLAHQGKLEKMPTGGFRLAKVHAMPKTA